MGPVDRLSRLTPNRDRRNHRDYRKHRDRRDCRDRPVRAVVAGALVMLAVLTLVLALILVVVVGEPGSVAKGGFTWVAGTVLVLILLAGAAIAGTVAARRLPGRPPTGRLPLAVAGPLAVMTLAVLPALFSGQWIGALLYCLPTLLGAAAGVLYGDRVLSRERIP